MALSQPDTSISVMCFLLNPRTSLRWLNSATYVKGLATPVDPARDEHVPVSFLHFNVVCEVVLCCQHPCLPDHLPGYDHTQANHTRSLCIHIHRVENTCHYHSDVYLLCWWEHRCCIVSSIINVATTAESIFMDCTSSWKSAGQHQRRQKLEMRSLVTSPTFAVMLRLHVQMRAHL